MSKPTDTFGTAVAAQESPLDYSTVHTHSHIHIHCPWGFRMWSYRKDALFAHKLLSTQYSKRCFGGWQTPPQSSFTAAKDLAGSWRALRKRTQLPSVHPENIRSSCPAGGTEQRALLPPSPPILTCRGSSAVRDASAALRKRSGKELCDWLLRGRREIGRGKWLDQCLFS